jgi:CHAT domain
MLNRQFVIQQLEDIEKWLHQDVDNRREGGGAGTVDLAAADYQAALDHVSIALTQEKAASSGQPGFVPPAPERRGRRPSPPLDDFVFMSRDPIVSIAQSALENGQTLNSTQILGMAGVDTIFEQKHPLVFLNACEVGRGIPALLGVGGFAKSFLDLGASAVIAPLWSVKDTIAHEIAETFYKRVKAEPNTPFAEICAT